MPLSPRDLPSDPSDNFQEPRCPWKLPYRICRSDFVEKKSFKDSMVLLNVSLPPKTRVASMFHSAGQRGWVPHRGLHKTSASSLGFVMAWRTAPVWAWMILNWHIEMLKHVEATFCGVQTSQSSQLLHNTSDMFYQVVPWTYWSHLSACASTTSKRPFAKPQQFDALHVHWSHWKWTGNISPWLKFQVS